MASVAAVLFLVVGCYRFNTLGGALGGFDNDHFVNFALAKQVEAGEQPLRDFLDVGLQGARPSLTYELSAAAQRLLGDNLRSEAWLTVAGVAAGAAVTFVAASHLAPWPVALATAATSAMLSPKLYGYPKVLVLAVACWLIVSYARRPSVLLAAFMAVWTAVAFLFRHDYAVYCGLGTVVVIGVAPRLSAWRRAVHVALCGGLVLIALAPSLYWIQRYAGVATYLRNGLEMGRREAQRTNIGWPVPVLGGAGSAGDLLAREENTQAWLYYLFLALAAAAPAVGALRLWRRGEGQERAAALFALGAMTLALTLLFLRGSLEARFGDMGPPVAVVGAALLADTARNGRAASFRLARVSVGVLLMGATIVCVWWLQGVHRELLRSGLLTSPAAVFRQTSRVSRELARLPEGLRQAGASPSTRAADYLYECTNPGDRVLVVSFAPEVGGLSGRLFAGGRATFIPGFYMDARYSRYVLDRLARQSVPLVLAEAEPYYAEFPLLPGYLRSNYADRGAIQVDGGHELRVLAAQNRQPVRSFGEAGLPCFR